jgi:uncharacterized membrane protein YdjX (TVP38/TMEM64 family)
MKLLRPFVQPALLLAGLLAAGLVLRLAPAGGAAGLLGKFGAGSGAWRVPELVLVGGALCAVGVPRQLVCYAGGLAFGAWIGGAAALAAEIFGCAANFFWARMMARRWAAARLRGRLARVDQALAARPFAATLTFRLLPVGNNLLLNLAAGLSGIKMLPFLAASALGYLPQTVVFALAGSGAHLGRTVQLALAAALFAASAALGAWLLRHPASPSRWRLARLAAGSADKVCISNE